jgi:hypothetical protein
LMVKRVLNSRWHSMHSASSPFLMDLAPLDIFLTCRSPPPFHVFLLARVPPPLAILLLSRISPLSQISLHPLVQRFPRFMWLFFSDSCYCCQDFSSSQLCHIFFFLDPHNSVTVWAIGRTSSTLCGSMLSNTETRNSWLHSVAGCRFWRRSWMVVSGNGELTFVGHCIALAIPSPMPVTHRRFRWVSEEGASWFTNWSWRKIRIGTGQMITIPDETTIRVFFIRNPDITLLICRDLSRLSSIRYSSIVTISCDPWDNWTRSYPSQGCKLR